MAFMKRARLLSLAAVLALLISACVPGAGPRLRVIHGQTWGADFNVEVTRSVRSGLVLPVTLELAFSQRLNDITADASLAYNTALFRINTGDTTLTGHLGIDGSLTLSNPNRLLQFDGHFEGDVLRGTVSIGGFVPVGDVTFRRVR